MTQKLGAFVAGALLMAAAAAGPAPAQKAGGILKVYHWDSPASMSIHEEATYSTLVPMMGVFNNLVMYDQHVPQNSLQSIVPDLATSWSWSDDGTQLTFRLRDGVKWHDGKPFTAKDVQCTWTCCSASRRRSCASIRGRLGTRTLSGLPPTGISR